MSFLGSSGSRGTNLFERREQLIEGCCKRGDSLLLELGRDLIHVDAQPGEGFVTANENGANGVTAIANGGLIGTDDEAISVYALQLRLTVALSVGIAMWYVEANDLLTGTTLTYELRGLVYRGVHALKRFSMLEWLTGVVALVVILGVFFLRSTRDY